MSNTKDIQFLCMGDLAWGVGATEEEARKEWKKHGGRSNAQVGTWSKPVAHASVDRVGYIQWDDPTAAFTWLER